MIDMALEKKFIIRGQHVLKNVRAASIACGEVEGLADVSQLVKILSI